MAEEKRPPEKEREKSILEGWERFAKEYRPGELNEQEKARFERALFAEEQARKTSFVLGGPVKIRL